MAKELREKHELDVQCILTKKQGHATEIARKLCKEGGELVLCLRRRRDGQRGRQRHPRLRQRRHDDYPRRHGQRPAQELRRRPREVPRCGKSLGRAGLPDGCHRGQRALCAYNRLLGIDARVAADVHKYSESPLLDGKSSYIVSLLVNFFFKGIGSHWKVEMDGEMEGDWSLVSVCNGRYYGGGFMPVAEARMDDGVLNTLVVQKVTRRAFIRFVGPYSKGEYYKFRTSRSATRRRSCASPPKSPTSSPVSTANAFRAARSPSVWPTRSSTSSAPQAAAAMRQRGAGEFDHFVNFGFFGNTPCKIRIVWIIISVSTQRL